MCPCQPNDSQFTVVLLAAAGVLLIVGILRRFWPRMTTSLRITAVVASIVSLAGVAFAFSRWGGQPATCSALTPSVVSSASAEAERSDTEAYGHPPVTEHDKSITTRPAEPQVIAYYFHRTIRCGSCLTIEEFSRQAIESGFVSEIAAEMLAWRSVNMEEKVNEHFVKELHLTEPSLVLVRMEKGRPADWMVLKGVWDHLEDLAAFQQYVQMQTQMFIYAQPASEP